VSADFVRGATLGDARDVGLTQIASWATTPGLPADRSLIPDVEEAARLWERAIFLPPSDRHQVWVATSDDVVVGAGAIAPASDPDLSEDTTSELVLFAVHPDHRRRGHGSRLLAALVHAMSLSADEAVAWVSAQDDQTRSYLEKAGWARDGAHRALSAVDEPRLDQQLRQVRLSTIIGSQQESPAGTKAGDAPVD